MSTTAESMLAGKTLGHYAVLRLLGTGGTGDVYVAHDTRLNRDVALKILRETAGAGDGSDRIRREALVLSQLNHPGIAAVYSLESEGGTCFLVGELVEGRTLEEVIAEGRLGVAEVLRIGIDIADAAAEAHKHGIVHRDLKPANVRLTKEGRAKVLDFGLALGLPPADDLTRSGYVEQNSAAGTLHYMSPEQLQGSSIDARSDIYSIGVILYEMLTARLPFEERQIASLINAVLHERPLPPSFWRPQIPSRIEEVLLRCLEKRPEHRYATCSDLAAELRHVVANEGERDRSVVVLYFENMSDESDAYLRDGMTEDITTELSRIKQLRLFSRSAVIPYRDKPVTPSFVGQKLGASYVLEGSLRRSGDQIRVTASLVQTRTGLTVWAERYDRHFEDVFTVQSEIAASIACALQLVLTEADMIPSSATTPNIKAYDFYLRGRHYFYQFRRRGYVLAREMFEKAIEADPNYGRAYAGIADCCAFEYMYWDSKPEYLERADEASRQALQVDPNMAEAHASRGLTASLSKKFEEAQREFETAIRLDPHLFEAYYFCARCWYSQGKLDVAARWFEQATRVSPDEYQSLMLWASTLNGLGRSEEALAVYRRGVNAAAKHLEIYPEDVRALYFGANGLTQTGEKDRARRWIARALDLEPDEPLVVYNVACVYALLGDVEPALSCLQRSITGGWAQKQWLINDPDLAPLRSHPRFAEMIAEVS